MGDVSAKYRTFAADAPFAALGQVRTSGGSRWAARVLLTLFVAFPFALLFVPWQQTLQGRGQIVAYAPTERRQIVTARVEGQIRTWHVREQQRVKTGDPIVDIDDNDMELESRLEELRKFQFGRREAATQEVSEQQAVVREQEAALAAAVSAAQANKSAAEMRVDVTKEQKKNAEFAVGFLTERQKRLDALFNHKTLPGLEPELNVMEATMRRDQSGTDVKAREADIKAAEATVKTNEAMILQARAAGMSAVAVAKRELRRAEQNVFATEREYQDILNRIERFKARFVKSPCDGWVHVVHANSAAGGQVVKAGDPLVEIVPDTVDRVVELMIDGVDAPLIAAHMEQTGTGPHVRLQFEGWPAIQFAGWPSVAAGTFGGKVRQMDPTDDGGGRFRIFVEPEEMFEGDTWPEGLYLRQGNQAIGWVFLNRVTVGYELWRQFNGFPPVVAPKAPDKGKSKDKDAKPPKVKV